MDKLKYVKTVSDSFANRRYYLQQFFRQPLGLVV